MTLSAAGQPVSISSLNVEVGVTATTQRGLDWLINNSKGFTDKDFNTMHNKAYFTNNNQGNCNNCASTGGDGAGGSYTACNCNNCDSGPKLQANCNCGSLCNCVYNCANCNCACVCADCNCCAC